MEFTGVDPSSSTLKNHDRVRIRAVLPFCWSIINVRNPCPVRDRVAKGFADIQLVVDAEYGYQFCLADHTTPESLLAGRLANGIDTQHTISYSTAD